MQWLQSRQQVVATTLDSLTLAATASSSRDSSNANSNYSNSKDSRLMVTTNRQHQGHISSSS